jgi:hypothetical protein
MASCATYFKPKNPVFHQVSGVEPGGCIVIDNQTDAGPVGGVRAGHQIPYLKLVFIHLGSPTLLGMSPNSE